jgi:hypothetical protein
VSASCDLGHGNQLAFELFDSAEWPNSGAHYDSPQLCDGSSLQRLWRV